MLLYFYVEEASTEMALTNLVPHILKGYEFEHRIFSFQGKFDLLRKLPSELKAYKSYPGDDWKIIILIDRDSDDCITLKQKLETITDEFGLVTRSTSSTGFQVINRIVIEELEAWFFGDVDALVSAYPRLDPNLAQKEAYRDPDNIKGGTWEKLESLLSYYHPGGLEKVRAAREISQHMNPDRNRSKSFQVFRDALRALFDEP